MRGSVALTPKRKELTSRETAQRAKNTEAASEQREPHARNKHELRNPGTMRPRVMRMAISCVRWDTEKAITA
jgi:hypothetical protein